VKGFGSSDTEVNIIGMYYSCAKAFRFTPEEVDKIDNTIVEGMLILEKAKNEKEADEMKKASRR